MTEVLCDPIVPFEPVTPNLRLETPQIDVVVPIRTSPLLFIVNSVSVEPSLEVVAMTKRFFVEIDVEAACIAKIAFGVVEPTPTERFWTPPAPSDSP